MLYLSVLLKGSDIKRASRRTVLLKGSDIKRASRRTVLLKGSDIKRASRRTVLLKGGYTGAIQLPLRQLEGVGIGRVVELPLPPKGML
jgi:type IV secretory pathway TrbD component